ncbi:MAG: GNAT family N-acetyltransferase [Clostridia bacterium]|nr:GNAT family N-acetyltransferase [Clostridia bacterium]MBQ8511543.1 GNAT family N-acetyltransferase [Clostridia bacterium]
MNITIRQACAGDFEKTVPIQQEIAELHCAGRPDLFREGHICYPREVFEEFVSRDDRVVLLAEADGAVVGFLFALIRHVRNHRVMQDFSMIYVDDLCVAQSHRRLGIGSILIAEAEKIGRSHGCTRMELDVQAFNGDAVRFYDAAGFAPRKITMEKGIAPCESI